MIYATYNHLKKEAIGDSQCATEIRRALHTAKRPQEDKKIQSILSKTFKAITIANTRRFGLLKSIGFANMNTQTFLLLSNIYIEAANNSSTCFRETKITQKQPTLSIGSAGRNFHN